jgi:thiol-disulfide isomerase/thioredoxin
MKVTTYSFFLLFLLFSYSSVSVPGSLGSSAQAEIVPKEEGIKIPNAQGPIGQLTKDELMNSAETDWFKKGYNSYTPDQAAVGYLRGIRPHIKVIAFGGTWCDDTHRELPHFYKIMDAAGIHEVNITVYSVDREKRSAAVDTKKYSLRRVPTFIVYYDGIEKGRVDETPAITLENDLVKILKR